MTPPVRPLPSRLVLLGHPVAHSLSPVFQNAALAAAGLPIRYEALDVSPDELAHVLAALRAEDAAGNVTVPHKRAVAALCEHVTPVAARTGAVNTFWFEDGRLAGDNTDVAGFAAAVDELLGLRAGERWPEALALLGSGGGARAVLVAAGERGVRRVALRARNGEAAAALAAEFPIVTLAGSRLPEDTSLVVNATTIGMRDEALPLHPDELPGPAAVLDLVYRRGETAWVRQCRAAGHRAQDGLTMLLAQGALAFERFTGQRPDLGTMRASLDPG